MLLKITYLWIDGYKNLKNLEIYLEKNSPVNALIGNNGSGKSNILEAVVKIFVSLKDGSKTDFDYEMNFSDNEEEYTISCKNQKYRLTSKNGSVTLKKSSSLLPSVIFLYYAGETNRLNELVGKCVDQQFDKAIKLNGEISLKYISFINVKDFAPAFLANHVFETGVCQRVCELVGIDELSTRVRFILKRPNWSKTAPITSDSFWNAKGTVATVLHQIKDLGELNIIDKNSAEIEISNIRSLKNIAVDTFELLVKFKLLVQADIIDEIDFKVLKEDIEMPLDFLSEGEKQISQLLLFLEATKDYKTLFLLDEIDSYLHPSWQRIFAEIIDDLNIRGQIFLRRIRL